MLYAQIFAQEPDITLVFDRGNNAQDNIYLLAENDRPFHFVGGLRLSQCADILKVPKAGYRALAGEEFGFFAPPQIILNMFLFAVLINAPCMAPKEAG